MKHTMKTSPMDLSLLNAEERAFIHQQTEKIQEFIDADSQLEMKVDLVEKTPPQKTTKKNKQMFKITLTLVEDGTRIQAKSRQGDFYTALAQASDRLVSALNQIQNEVITSQERTMEIKNAFDSRYLH